MLSWMHVRKLLSFIAATCVCILHPLSNQEHLNRQKVRDWHRVLQGSTAHNYSCFWLLPATVTKSKVRARSFLVLVPPNEKAWFDGPGKHEPAYDALSLYFFAQCNGHVLQILPGSILQKVQKNPGRKGAPVTRTPKA